MTGDITIDRRTVIDSLRCGHAYIGYDLPQSTRGFRFTATSKDQTVIPGDTIFLESGITIQIRLPQKAECRLIRNGNIHRIWHHGDICTEIINQPGVYRVECYINFLGKSRGWIFSNPIYVRQPPS